MENKELERRVLTLIAQDRIEAPLSSMYQMTKRRKAASASEIGGYVLPATPFHGERVFAYSAQNDVNKARRLKEAVTEFKKRYPKYGDALTQVIEEKRSRSETHLSFGTNPNAKLTADDYIGVMTSLGLSEQTSRNLYPDLVEISRRLKKKRDEGVRSVLIGKSNDPVEEFGED